MEYFFFFYIEGLKISIKEVAFQRGELNFKLDSKKPNITDFTGQAEQAWQKMNT